MSEMSEETGALQLRFNFSWVLFFVQNSRREWSYPQPMVWPSLSPHHSPKPSWIKLRFVSRHQPHFPFSDKEPELFAATGITSEPSGLWLRQCCNSHQTLVLVVWSRFPPRAAQLLQSTPASRSQPVNSAWRKSSSLHPRIFSGSFSTRRWDVRVLWWSWLFY